MDVADLAPGGGRPTARYREMFDIGLVLAALAARTTGSTRVPREPVAATRHCETRQ
ncbi:hypothetical protein [Dactylosporangium sp. NPDC049140]|uniref:hypothetical protein n=1 Tax=Dactylosporangium sp. NPDC049140 TaxID=3155647 RepID=UPI0033F2F5F1